MNQDFDKLEWSFVGNPEIAVHFLVILKEKYNITPNRIYAFTDKPTGRKQTLTPPPVCTWGREHGIDVIQTNNLDEYTDALARDDFVCVFAYGAKISSILLDLDTTFINIHPSLLPVYRGASPITQAIIDDTKFTGISLIEMSEEMDAGDIIAQTIWKIDEWCKYTQLEQEAAKLSVELFVQTIPGYIAGDILPQEQDHQVATYTHKYTKADMQIKSSMDSYEQYRRYCAFEKPFVISQDRRFVITDASYTREEGFAITRVIPEGKQEQDAQDMLFE